jgi:putative oxidoreductase
MITAYRRATATLDKLPDLALALARLALGVLFIVHGLNKFHAKGGLASFEYFLRSLNNVPAPALTSHVVPALEVVGGALLIAGLLTRVVAVLFAAEMVVTGFLVKAHDLHVGLVEQRVAGVELDLVFLVAVALLVVFGPGGGSIDALLRLEGRGRFARAGTDTRTGVRVGLTA